MSYCLSKTVKINQCRSASICFLWTIQSDSNGWWNKYLSLKNHKILYMNIPSQSLYVKVRTLEINFVFTLRAEIMAAKLLAVSRNWCQDKQTGGIYHSLFTNATMSCCSSVLLEHNRSPKQLWFIFDGTILVFSKLWEHIIPLITSLANRRTVIMGYLTC